MLKRMRRIGLFVLAIAVVISSAIIASANERSSNTGSATAQSTASSYVIENKSSDKKDITVTIQHYNGSKKIYSDDVKTLSYGSKINDYAKAINWDVSSVTVDGNAVSNKNYIELTGSGSATVVVNYTTETTYVNGATTFYDYVVKPFTKGNTWQDDVVYPSQSINYAGNYPENSSETNRIGVGNIDSLNKWTTAQNPQPITEADKTNDGTTVNQAYYTEKSYATSWGSTDVRRINTYNHGNAVTGLITGLSDDYKNVNFSVDEPGLFSNEEKAGKNIINNYQLRFSKSGDTYELTNVLNEKGNSVADNMNQFFPLDNTEFHKNHPDKGNDRDNSHNYYFGMRYDVTFKLGDYVGDLNYYFEGDDDLWVILDGKQVIIDLGGIHDGLEKEVNLWEILGLTPGELTNEQKNKEHRITVLYMERGGNQSHCHMKFTLPSARISEVTDIPLADLSLQKIDKDDNSLLANARFTLTDSNGEKQSATSDENGNLTFTNLKVGEYTLTEDVSPDGYMAADSSWKVKVTEVDSKTAVAKLYLVKDGQEQEVAQTDGKYKIENKKQPVAPTPNESIDDKMDYNKTATVNSWDDRTYDINITASSKLTQSTTEETQGLADMMLVLDMSGSMGYGPTSSSKSAATCNYINNNKNNSKFSQVQLQMDKTKIYYANNNSSNPIVYLNNKWMKYENSQWKNVTNNDTISTCNSRVTALKESVNALLYEIANKSSNSKIGITTFSSEKETDRNGNVTNYPNHKQVNSNSLQTIGNDPTELIKFFNKYSAVGGTRPGDGLEIAYNQLKDVKNSGDTLPKYVVLFTDGEPTGNSNQWNTTAQKSAEDWASKIKNELGVKVYTIGFALSDKTKTFLSGGTYGGETYPGIATDASYAYNADSAGQLGDIFQTISSTITSNISITNANIVDVIDPRFQITYKNENNEEIVISNEDLKDGNTIEITTSNGKKGIVYLYEDPENNLVTQAIKWEGQTLPNVNNDGETAWNTTITVKARDEYIGGNNVPTNVSPDSKITTGFGDAVLPQPKVNVKVDIAISNDDIWINSGETVPVDDTDIGNSKVFDIENIVNSKGNVVYKYNESTKEFEKITKDDLTIQWYTDDQCTTETTKDKISKVKPDGRTDFFLKVGYDGGSATDESNTNTNGNKVGNSDKSNIGYAINDGEKGNDKECITDFENCKKNKSEYGIYRIHVKYTLPETGGTGIYWYMAGGMLLMMVAAVAIYRKRYNEYMNK